MENESNPTAAESTATATGTTAQTVFQVLRGIDVTPYLERKDGFCYLNWAVATDLLLSRFEDVQIDITHYNGLPYMPCPVGYMVEVGVTINGTKRKSLLPVMDDAFNPILSPTSYEINTSIQRCTVKAMALHGLGLSVYMGQSDLAVAVQAGAQATDKPSSTAPAATGGVATASGSSTASSADTKALEAEDEANLQAAFSRLKVSVDPARLKNALSLVKFKSDSATKRFHEAVALRVLELGGVLKDVFVDMPIPAVSVKRPNVESPTVTPPVAAAPKAAAPVTPPVSAPTSAPSTGNDSFF